jgi:hypothetical protein
MSAALFWTYCVEASERQSGGCATEHFADSVCECVGPAGFRGSTGRLLQHCAPSAIENLGADAATLAEQAIRRLTSAAHFELWYAQGDRRSAHYRSARRTERP